MHDPWVAPVFPTIRLRTFCFPRIHAPLIQVMRSGSCLSGQCTALICGIRYSAFRKQQEWRTTPKRDRSRCVGDTGRTIQQASRCLGCEWSLERVEISALRFP